MSQNVDEPAGTLDGPSTKRETKYDAEGNMDKYKEMVQRSMEKPYPGPVCIYISTYVYISYISI